MSLARYIGCSLKIPLIIGFMETGQPKWYSYNYNGNGILREDEQFLRTAAMVLIIFLFGLSF